MYDQNMPENIEGQDTEWFKDPRFNNLSRAAATKAMQGEKKQEKERRKAEKTEALKKYVKIAIEADLALAGALKIIHDAKQQRKMNESQYSEKMAAKVGEQSLKLVMKNMTSNNFQNTTKVMSYENEPNFKDVNENTNTTNTYDFLNNQNSTSFFQTNTTSYNMTNSLSMNFTNSSYSGSTSHFNTNSTQTTRPKIEQQKNITQDKNSENIKAKDDIQSKKEESQEKKVSLEKEIASANAQQQKIQPLDNANSKNTSQNYDWANGNYTEIRNRARNIAEMNVTRSANGEVIVSIRLSNNRTINGTVAEIINSIDQNPSEFGVVDNDKASIERISNNLNNIINNDIVKKGNGFYSNGNQPEKPGEGGGQKPGEDDEQETKENEDDKQETKENEDDEQETKENEDDKQETKENEDDKQETKENEDDKQEINKKQKKTKTINKKQKKTKMMNKKQKEITKIYKTEKIIIKNQKD